nr:probable endonuclease 4 [Lepeophtheirus salmonis]
MTEKLNIKYYIFHPGSDVNKMGVTKSLVEMANQINKTLDKFSKVCLVVEIMAGTNNTTNSNIGNKDRFGFCLDTCHMFASGYDFRTQHKYDNLISKIDNLIGLDTIKVIHLNDSKHPIGSRKDRHEHLGMGKIGIDAFRFFMEDERLDEKVFILETPSDEKYKEEIQILRDFLL